MHQFSGHESAVCEVPSPTQPFTPTVCDVNETVWQKCTALLCDEEWSAIGQTKSSFLFVFCPVSDEHPITTGTKDCSVFGGSRVNRNPHGRTLSDFLAKAVNESTFSVLELFIIQTNEIEICNSKSNRYSELQRFFQIGTTQKWDNFKKVFCGCCSSPFLLFTFDLICSRTIDWLDSLLIHYSTKSLSGDDVRFCYCGFAVERTPAL
jgi:hypothetical protein